MTDTQQRALERTFYAITAEHEAQGKPRAAALFAAHADVTLHLYAVSEAERDELARTVAAGPLFRVHPGPATDAFAEAIREQEDTNGEDVGAMANARANADAAFRRMIEQDW